MSPLRTIARDLIDRRLWPLAALLAVGLVAIPVVFLRPAPNAVSEAPAPAAATAPPSNPAAAAPAAAAPSDPTADPSVALTSSPFAAAFAGPLDLPPSMQGLLKATQGTDERRAVADAPLRDPFSSGIASVSAAPASSAAPRAAVAAAPAAASSTPAPVPGPGPSAPSAVPSTPSTPAGPSTPSPTTPPASADDWRVFRADVSFGNTETLPVDSDASRLTAYPSLFNPVAIYLGVMRGGWGAVFMLRDDVRPVGAPSCRPRKSICTWIILHPGESVTLNAKDAATGVVTPYTLKLAAIREDTVSEDAAKAFYAKANAGGRCLLGPLAAYHYDAGTGTLALRPEMKACRYQGDPGTDAGTTAGDGT